MGDFSLRRCLRSLAFIYITISIYVFFVSNKMIFPARPSSYTDTPDILKIPTGAGGSLSAIYLFHSNAHFTVLYNHGNAEDLGDIRPYLEEYSSHGFSVLAYDYQGYGTSEGRPSEANEPKSYLWIDGAGHDDLCWSGDQYWGGLLAFESSLLNP